MGGRIAVVILVGLGLLCIGLAAVMIVRDRGQIAEARAWPQAAGRVDETRMDVQRSSGRQSKTRYIPKISYSYDVAGRTYRNHYIWLTATRSWTSRPEAEAFLRGYPLGAAIPVFYDPADPRRSALIVETSSAPFYLVGAVGLFLLAFAAWVARATRKKPALGSGAA